MRAILTAIVAVMLTAALWSGGSAVYAEDRDLPNGRGFCDSAGSFTPGTNLGPAQIGMPLNLIPQWYGRPTLVENRSLQGHLWTHLRFTNLDVLGRDNSVVALNVLRQQPVMIPQHCITQGINPYAPFNVSTGHLQQTYGPPIQNVLLNGLQYWLYDKLGLLVTVPVGGTYVQGLTVYQPNRFCYLAPAFVSFGRFSANTGSALQCSMSAADREK